MVEAIGGVVLAGVSDKEGTWKLEALEERLMQRDYDFSTEKEDGACTPLLKAARGEFEI